VNLKHILVAVDFSTYAEKVLGAAIKVAEGRSLHITIVHVASQQALQDSCPDYQAYRSRLDELKTRLTGRLEPLTRKAPDLGFTFDVSAGDPAADHILELAEELNAGMVVMGSHDQEDQSSFGEGSVSEKTVLKSPVPVLTVHASAVESTVRKILVPVDFSPHSHEAAMIAGRICEQLGIRMVLMHVVEREAFPRSLKPGIRIHLEEGGLHRLIAREVQDFVNEIGDPGVVEDVVVREGIAHREIGRYVEENEIDLVVISSHGLTDMVYVDLGSVAQKVFRWSPCSILTLKR